MEVPSLVVHSRLPVHGPREQDNGSYGLSVRGIMKTQPIRKNVRSQPCRFGLLGTYRDFFFRKDCASGFSALLMTEPMLLDVLDRT